MYAWFWFHTQFWLPPEERRPYTFIIRDFYRDHPILWSFLMFLAGYFSFNHLRPWDFAKVSVGLLLGHLFWGARYKPGEQESPEYLGGESDAKTKGT